MLKIIGFIRIHKLNAGKNWLFRTNAIIYSSTFKKFVIMLVLTIGVRGRGAQCAEFWICCSHSSAFQVTSSIISSLNATLVVYSRYQFVVFKFFSTFRITKFSWQKSGSLCPSVLTITPRGPLGKLNATHMI